MNKVLIVDDQQQNLYLMKTLLEGHDYQVVEATNGAEALELARLDPPDVIISDILMPVMDGFSLCQEWMKDGDLRNVPFVFYTATYTDPKDEELALSLGAARFIVKPVEIEEFVSILEQVIAEFESGLLAVPQKSPHEDTAYYRMYNEALIRKLEDKILELE
jgi:CheY-like chemotaxis protein